MPSLVKLPSRKVNLKLIYSSHVINLLSYFNHFMDLNILSIVTYSKYKMVTSEKLQNY